MYEDVVREITIFFREKIIHLNELGIYDIVLDPGFGFGKTTKHNYQLLQHLCTFSIFGLPLLAGVSRKSLICKVLHTRPEGALNGTTVLNTIALMNGAMMLRVHDVKEAKEAIQLTEELKNAAVKLFSYEFQVIQVIDVLLVGLLYSNCTGWYEERWALIFFRHAHHLPVVPADKIHQAPIADRNTGTICKCRRHCIAHCVSAGDQEVPAAARQSRIG
jgi:hypothetical protein